MWTCLFIYNDTAQARLDWGASVIQSGKKLSLMVSLESSRRYWQDSGPRRRWRGVQRAWPAGSCVPVGCSRLCVAKPETGVCSEQVQKVACYKSYAMSGCKARTRVDQSWCSLQVPMAGQNGEQEEQVPKVGAQVCLTQVRDSEVVSCELKYM